MIDINENYALPENEIEMNPIRSQGAGGQNVNKVSTAIHLRFDIESSSLPTFIKNRLLKLKDKRISSDGILIIKAQKHRTQLQNREYALELLKDLIKSVLIVRKTRVPTKTPRKAKLKRLEDKSHRSDIKKLRGKI